MSGEPPSSEPGSEPPPVLGSWRRVYAVVLAELAISVLLLYALARWAS